MVSVDDVVSHQVLLVIVIEVVVPDELRVDVVNVVVAVVDDWLIDCDVCAIVDELLRVSGLLCGGLCDDWSGLVLESLLGAWKSDGWGSDGSWSSSDRGSGGDWGSSSGSSEWAGHDYSKKKLDVVED